MVFITEAAGKNIEIKLFHSAFSVRAAAICYVYEGFFDGENYTANFPSLCNSKAVNSYKSPGQAV